MRKVSAISVFAIVTVMAALLVAWVFSGLGPRGGLTPGNAATLMGLFGIVIALAWVCVRSTRPFAERLRLEDPVFRAEAAAERVCLRCGYSLRSLSLEGRCPECGLAYDHTKASICLRCGYPLNLLPRRGRCPECGTAYDLDDRRRMIGLVPEDDDAPGDWMMVETKRLRMRELTMDDLDAITTMLTDPETQRVWGRSMSRDDAVAWIEKQRGRYEADGCGYWLCVGRRAGEVVGQAGIVMIEVDGRREASLGWMIAPEHRGRGHATEAAAACLAWAFEHMEAERVIAPVRPENPASIRVAERIGMREGWRTEFAGFEHVIYVKEASGE